MSIHVEISRWVTQGQLFPLHPLFPPLPQVSPRYMYLSEEVRSLIIGPWDSPEWEERCGYLHADLDKFSQGSLIPVAGSPFRKGRTSYMRQLGPWRREVWEIRSRDPDPGIRVLGRFADTDVFIALSWWRRADLGGPGSRAWRDAIVACNTKWTHLFPAYAPISSGGASVYPTACISAQTYLV